MNIIEYLSEDHDKFRNQIRTIHRCLNQGCLKEKIDGFIRLYRRHQSIEERVLFPFIAKAGAAFAGGGELVAEFKARHQETWRNIDRMVEALQYSGFEFLQQVFFDFSAAAEAHMDHEDRVVFPEIVRSFNGADLEELGKSAAGLTEVEAVKKPGRILIPVDFSQASLEALDVAAMIAGHVGSELVLLSVQEIPVYEGYPAPPISFPDPGEGESRLLAAFRERALLWPKDPPFAYEKGLKVLWRVGGPVEQILAAASETQADIIVVGTHGRRGLSRAILGSVAEQVIRRAPCPVLAIRAGTSPLAREAELAAGKKIKFALV